MKSISLSKLLYGGMRPDSAAADDVIFNRPLPDGSYRPVIQFFNKAAGLCILCGNDAKGASYCEECTKNNDKLLEELSK